MILIKARMLRNILGVSQLARGSGWKWSAYLAGDAGPVVQRFVLVQIMHPIADAL